MRLLHHDSPQGCLVVALAVENAAPGEAAAELGIDRTQVTGTLREAVGTLARQYESVAS